jgi:hypothetical protein
MPFARGLGDGGSPQKDKKRLSHQTQPPFYFKLSPLATGWLPSVRNPQGTAR